MVGGHADSHRNNNNNKVAHLRPVCARLRYACNHTSDIAHDTVALTRWGLFPSGSGFGAHRALGRVRLFSPRLAAWRYTYILCAMFIQFKFPCRLTCPRRHTVQIFRVVSLTGGTSSEIGGSSPHNAFIAVRDNCCERSFNRIQCVLGTYFELVMPVKVHHIFVIFIMILLFSLHTSSHTMDKATKFSELLTECLFC